MNSGAFSAAEWFALGRHELMLFAASLFLLGALDELAVDGAYLWLRLTGRARTSRIDERDVEGRALSHRCAVFIPAWGEAAVIADTVRHALAAWPQERLRLYVGCYANDPATAAAAHAGAGADPRVEVVVHDVPGPTCKADCLNRLYRAMARDEAGGAERVRMVVLHDAEDMVDPAALPLLDAAMAHADFVQLPVLAMPQPGSPFIAGHYSDEFAESHARTMVVRDALGQGIPGAGVGCAIARDWLDRLDARRDGEGPFATGALTEDYELGLQLAAMGARSRFLRVRTERGRLVATRSYFPHTLGAAIRQKTRWLHGIALQGWDRLGWRGSPSALWMQLRDRRGPLAAFLLALAYALIVIFLVEMVLAEAGILAIPPVSSGLRVLLFINAAALVWRLACRMLFTTREFGIGQGLLSIPRVAVSNTVAIVAARRAFFAYIRWLRGATIGWDKTEHFGHPSLAEPARRPPNA